MFSPLDLEVNSSPVFLSQGLSEVSPLSDLFWAIVHLPDLFGTLEFVAETQQCSLSHMRKVLSR